MATHNHDLTVQKELSDAHTLTEKFAATVGALGEGRIGMRHAQAILETGIVLDDDGTRAGWEQVVLARAERDSPGRVRAFGRELAESVHPVGMTERHARAAATRGVSVRDLADGMAELSVILPATVAYGIRDRLRRQAAAIRAADTETSAEEPARSTGADRGSDAHAGRGGGTAPIPTDGTPAVGEDAGSEAPATLDERGEATPEAPAHAALVSVGAPAEVTALVSVCVPIQSRCHIRRRQGARSSASRSRKPTSQPTNDAVRQDPHRPIRPPVIFKSTGPIIEFFCHRRISRCVSLLTQASRLILLLLRIVSN
ncbi:DUF222 domain-containing protein [Microbacterium sp. B19]|uniref:DUF222 domain-containing protein n=1 Tax=Microbacterium sp. B19 TaxID=96765 RepID=UPI00034509CA